MSCLCLGELLNFWVSIWGLKPREFPRWNWDWPPTQRARRGKGTGRPLQREVGGYKKQRDLLPRLERDATRQADLWTCCQNLKGYMKTSTRFWHIHHLYQDHVLKNGTPLWARGWGGWAEPTFQGYKDVRSLWMPEASSQVNQLSCLLGDLFHLHFSNCEMGEPRVQACLIFCKDWMKRGYLITVILIFDMYPSKVKG